MEKSFKICFLAYGALFEAAQKVIDSLEYDDTEILLLECNVETLPKAVDRGIAEGCEAFIAAAANAAEFVRYSHEHLVEIRLSNVDYLLAIKEAAKLGERSVIASYRYGRAVDQALLEELSGVPLKVLSYEDGSELYHGIANTEADVVIGASHAVQIANELQKKSVLLRFSEGSIRAAIQRARGLIIELHKTTRNSRITQAIIHYAPFGMTVSDEQGRIVIFNQALRRLTGLEGAHVQDRLLSEVIPPISPEEFLESDARQTDQRRLINGAMLRYVQTRIEDKHRVIGVLTTVYPDNARRSKQTGADSYRALGTWKEVAAKSGSMQAMIREAKLLADQPHPLVIEGESGSGKNFYAQCIHNGSLRAKEPYMTINAAALPDQEATRVLFGSEDVTGVHMGLLELAQGGTVVLQNLPGATPVVQSCLLQVLSERQFLRLGTTMPIPFQARFITCLSSDKDHANMPEALWQRLSVFRLPVPPLRERKEDILPLFAAFAAQEMGASYRRVGNELRDLIQFYSWPGNMAELSSVCKRYAFALRQVERPTANARANLLIEAIGEDALFAEILRQYPALNNPAVENAQEVFAGIDRMKQLLKYNNDKIAERLSLSRTTLWRLKKGLDNTK